MKRKGKLKIPVPKPFTREPIPAPRMEPDRKKKHPRQAKHKGREWDA